MSRLENDLNIAEEIKKIERVYAQIELEKALVASQAASQAASQKAIIPHVVAPAPANANANVTATGVSQNKPAVSNISNTKTMAEAHHTNESIKLPARLVVDYWPSWSSNWTRDDLRNTPNAVNVINIAFALPDGKGSIGWSDDINPPATKEVIKGLQKKNKLVLISIGGATAQSWNLHAVNINTFAQNIKKFVDEYSLNGVDIDYEMNEHRHKLVELIKALRLLMPKNKYCITYAGWSIGAYGVKGYEHAEWNNNPNKGNDIPVLNQVKDLIDWVNVMSYDAFDPTIKPAYDPREAILAFSTLLGNKPDKVTLGMIVGKQSWPQNAITKIKEVEPWVNFTKTQHFRGIMFWYLKNDVESATGDPTGSFTKLALS